MQRLRFGSHETFEPGNTISYKIAGVPSEVSDQTEHPRSRVSESLYRLQADSKVWSVNAGWFEYLLGAHAVLEEMMYPGSVLDDA